MGAFQFSLLPNLKKQYEHGGDLLVGKRKSKRPFDRKRPLHLVFRSDLAVGRHSFLMPANKQKARDLLMFFAKKWRIRIWDVSFNSNHIHLLASALDRQSLNHFLRAFPGAAAMAITGARKGHSLLKKFWSVRVYSRIVEWGRAFGIVRRYILKNRLEAEGVISYEPRAKRRSTLAASRLRDLRE